MGILDWFFQGADRVIDAVDPIHNKVQTWTTGSKTTDGQSPYFQAIAPMILNAFVPGAGSAVAAADGASTGNWTKAGIGALGAYAGMGGFSGVGDGATAASGASSSSDGLTASEGLSSTAGDAAGSSTTAGDIAASNDASMAASDQSMVNSVPNGATAGQPGEGWQYYDNGTAISPSGQYYLNGEQITGAGGQPMGLLDHAGVYAGKASQAFSNNGGSLGKTALAGGGMLMQQQQAAAQKAAMMHRAPTPMLDAGTPAIKARSFQNDLSPYAKFNGGFNPRKYGANVRKPNGLLG